MPMKQLARFFGGIGLILLIFGGVAIALFGKQFFAIGFIQFGLGVVGILLFFVYFLGDALQTISRKREAIYGAFGAILILFILIGANVIAHSKFGERKFDMTANKIHSLSDTSVQLIKDLKVPITINAFFQPGAQQIDPLKSLVSKYTYVNPQVTLNIYDPDKEPAKVQEMDARPNTVVVRNEKTKKTVKLASVTEQDVSTAIRNVMRMETKTVYFLKGHGEGDLEDSQQGGMYVTKYLLESEGYKVQALELAANPEIPKDASIVVAWGAERPYTKNEVDTLMNWLDRGGNLIIGQDPILAATKDHLVSSGLEPILDKYGLTFMPAIILQTLFGGQFISMKLPISDYGKDTPISSKLSKDKVCEFSTTQPVLQKDNFKDTSIKRSVIASSSPESWAEVDMSSIFKTGKPTFKGSDKKGPLPVGEIAEWNIPAGKVKDQISPKAKLVVYGNSGFGWQLIQSGYNRDLFLNTFSYMTGEEASLTIRPKAWTTSTLDINPSQRRLIDYMSLFIIPELIMGLGMVIWLQRRSRA